jgi:hypothetical protein
LEKLYSHRITHLEKYSHKLRSSDDFTDPTLPTKQELSTYHRGQLSLFPKDSGMTLIQWSREKVDFLELFTSVYDSKAIKSIGGKKFNKKEFFGLVTWFFNIQIPNLENSLQSMRNRKISQAPYLTELQELFVNYINR